MSPGIKYLYYVSAVNTLGGEGWLSEPVTVSSIDIPTQPNPPQYVENDLTSITVNWVQPISDGSSPILYYSLEMKPEFENEFVEIYRGYSFSYKIMNLMTGFAYKFRVKAVNKEGPGPVSAASTSIYTALEPSEV